MKCSTWALLLILTGRDIRLTGGGGNNEGNGYGRMHGRVEFLRRNTWGTICENEFDDIDATVICRYLDTKRGIVIPSLGPGRG